MSRTDGLGLVYAEGRTRIARRGSLAGFSFEGSNKGPRTLVRPSAWRVKPLMYFLIAQHSIYVKSRVMTALKSAIEARLGLQDSGGQQRFIATLNRPRWSDSTSTNVPHTSCSSI